ncbi:MAG: hypothetical protein BRC33_01245 [Cyanobacteria bacterium SW_9_44_58]|nr:MAG: hypothetical protein BRC33_01245 [Cyanobacteria bacterium SW_9_44_58]
MKALRRWSIRFGLFSGAMASMLWGMTATTLALPQSQIIEKLKQVPVFTVANEKGSPLVASGGNNSRVTGVFMSQQDAQEFVNNLKKENPELGNKVQVVPISLGRVYKLDKQNEGKSKELDFRYVPMEEEVNSALSVLKQQGQDIDNFGGVPLFIARGGEDQGYLTVKRGNGDPVIPMFFEKEQLENMIDKFKESQPQNADSVKIDVTTLESVLKTLEENNNEQLKQVVLVPSQESMQFIQQNSQQQN